MVRELATERALDDGLLEPPDRRLKLLMGDRALADELVENLRRDRRQWRGRVSGRSTPGEVTSRV